MVYSITSSHSPRWLVGAPVITLVLQARIKEKMKGSKTGSFQMRQPFNQPSQNFANYFHVYFIVRVLSHRIDLNAGNWETEISDGNVSSCAAGPIAKKKEWVT